MNKNAPRRKAGSKGILSGVRVLDFSRATGAPYGSMMLAELGAEVIKIETPETAFGVTTRQKFDPDYILFGDDLHFHSLNKNKRSIVLDLSQQEGKELFYDLVSVSDVVLDNFRPGVLKRLGIDYTRLKKVNPGIISCSVTGFGSTGPHKDRAAFDIIIQGSSGLMDFIGKHDVDGRPSYPRLAVADLTGGMYAAYAIVSALYRREKNGRGCKLDIGMQDVVVSQLIFCALYPLNFGINRNPMDRMLWGAFRTKDRYIIICAHREKFWNNICQALGHKEWLNDDRFNTNSKRMKNKDELWGMIESILKERTTAEWLDILNKNDVPCAPINTIEEVLNDAQNLHRKMVVSVNRPGGREIKLLGNPIKTGSKHDDVVTAPPVLGQHTREICLSVLGYGEEKVNDLVARGIIATD